MNTTIKECLTQLEVGEPTTFANMTVLPVVTGGDMPLLFAAAPEVEFVTMQEGMSDRTVHVEELPGGGSVPEVLLVNEGKLPVILIDGEEIIGAQQNRMINTTLVVAAETSLTIPVSCVEAGRWHARTHQFGHAGRIVPHEIRTRKSRSVAASVREGRGHRSDQQEVWRNVHEVHESLGTHSPTESLSDACDARTGDVEEYLAHFPALDGQIGCVVATNGRVAGLETLATPALYSRLHRQIVFSHAMQAALSPHRPASGIRPERLRRLVKRAAASRWTKCDAPGVGEQYRAENKDLVGTATLHAGRVVHLVVSAT